MMIHFSAKGNDIYPWDNIHESCTNPPKDIWRVTFADIHAVICIWISDLGLVCTLQITTVMTTKERDSEA